MTIGNSEPQAKFPWRRTGFGDTRDECAVYDDLPLWSAPFGLALLDEIPMRGVTAALDIGCGTGFPLVELADRLGRGVRVVGMDPWEHGLERAKAKLRVRDLNHVELVCSNAEQMPFANQSFDLIVSNNGINNVATPQKVLAECYRVARPSASLVLTVNLPHTMKEFYACFERVLGKSVGPNAVQALHAHIADKRKESHEVLDMVKASGFCIVRAVESSFRLRYANASAFLDHWFIRLAFEEHWTALVPSRQVDQVFLDVMRELDETVAYSDGLTMTVPFVCVVAQPLLNFVHE